MSLKNKNSSTFFRKCLPIEPDWENKFPGSLIDLVNFLIFFSELHPDILLFSALHLFSKTVFLFIYLFLFVNLSLRGHVFWNAAVCTSAPQCFVCVNVVNNQTCCESLNYHAQMQTLGYECSTDTSGSFGLISAFKYNDWIKVRQT